MNSSKVWRVALAAWVVMTMGAGTGTALAASYTVDPDHSTVGFKIKHLFSKVSGKFTQYDASFEVDEAQPQGLMARATIKAASIDTGVKQRDKHLIGNEFFDVENHPEIKYQSTGVTVGEDGKLKLDGLITIKGIEKPITMDVELHGVGKDPWGNVRMGLTATGVLNRKDFGINWNEALETGGFLVGDDVEIILEIEGIQQ